MECASALLSKLQSSIVFSGETRRDAARRGPWQAPGLVAPGHAGSLRAAPGLTAPRPTCVSVRSQSLLRGDARRPVPKIGSPGESNNHTIQPSQQSSPATRHLTAPVITPNAGKAARDASCEHAAGQGGWGGGGACKPAHLNAAVPVCAPPLLLQLAFSWTQSACAVLQLSGHRRCTASGRLGCAPAAAAAAAVPAAAAVRARSLLRRQRPLHVLRQPRRQPRRLRLPPEAEQPVRRCSSAAGWPSERPKACCGGREAQRDAALIGAAGVRG